MVDLAGSEKTKNMEETVIDEKHLKESSSINKSLFVLRKVINLLAKLNQNQEKTVTHMNNQSIVPFRESKLTSLLKQSLGGNSYTVMIACLNPCD
mmetsp:Transcript_22068/g.21252  ORF Transcript_22068/g.21252 Transcript_22068/m.21252 type:complete len:95 (+) Transcript_22068:34-318(+)